MVPTRTPSRRGEHSNRRYGARAEESARAFLVAQGYTLVQQNYTVRGGEVDVVAREGEVLCFVEIKARRNNAFGPAVLAVDARKRKRMAVAADRWLLEHPCDCPVRFDVLCRDREDAPWELIRDAFRPEAEP
ncbi:MAG: YraN family protein [Myxococcota bacterium]